MLGLVWHILGCILFPWSWCSKACSMQVKGKAAWLCINAAPGEPALLERHSHFPTADAYFLAGNGRTCGVGQAAGHSVLSGSRVEILREPSQCFQCFHFRAWPIRSGWESGEAIARKDNISYPLSQVFLSATAPPPVVITTPWLDGGGVSTTVGWSPGSQQKIMGSTDFAMLWLEVWGLWQTSWAAPAVQSQLVRPSGDRTFQI